MDYEQFVLIYEKLASTSKRLEKTSILESFIKELSKFDSKFIYLLEGRVLPEYDNREFGISNQLVIKLLAKTYITPEAKIQSQLNKIGDLGLLAEQLANEKKQSRLVSNKLTVNKVFDTLHKLFEVSGKGAVDIKMNLLSELLSRAKSNEVKYLVRTMLSDLRIGIAAPTIVDALANNFSIENSKIQRAFDLVSDFAQIFDACKSGEKELNKITLIPGRPVHPMLSVKVKDIQEAFEVCGKPAGFEFKYDGFRVLIHKQGNKISLFTRKLEDVTKQFPDVVSAVQKYIKGDSFILDSEVVGYNSQTKKYTPFEAISQRIRRKYDIDLLVKELPVEINVFDVLYYEGKLISDKPFIQRRELLQKIVNSKPFILKPSEFFITDNEDKAQEFYERALEVGEEGIMIKSLQAEYHSGRSVGYMAKLKPVMQDLDLVITGAEYGTGKRAGWLTSYIVACKSGSEYLEVGKVSSGLKEKESEGVTYEYVTKLLKPLIIEKNGNYVKVKPEVVLAVTYQNIQPSPSYSSGYALRFPRVMAYRPDKPVSEIADLKDVKKAT